MLKARLYNYSKCLENLKDKTTIFRQIAVELLNKVQGKFILKSDIKNILHTGEQQQHKDG